jgi:ABC-type uncharacterized transport system permease subunit
MMTNLLGLLAILSYGCAALSIFKTLKPGNLCARNGMRLAWLGVTLHAAYIGFTEEQYQQLDFSLLNSSVLISLSLAFIWLIAALNNSVEKLGIGILPLAALLIGLDMIVPQAEHPLSQHSWPMITHVLSSMIAFSLLSMAALQAILLIVQEHQLRQRKPLRLMLALPPLQNMERFMFQMVTAGLVCLTVSLGSGILFIEHLFAQHLAHKTILSLCAWLIFSALLWGRLRYGWRGKTAAHWLLAGFSVLLLAYFGSNVVLQIILHRT